MPDRGTHFTHRTRVERARFGLPGTPDLFGATCSCGWQSESLWSDPEAAENDACDHERGERDEADTRERLTLGELEREVFGE